MDVTLYVMTFLLSFGLKITYFISIRVDEAPCKYVLICLLIRDTTNTNQVVHWFLEERGNWSTRRKPLGAEKRTDKLNPHLTPDLGIEPGPHWWEVIALTTAPSLHPS